MGEELLGAGDELAGDGAAGGIWETGGGAPPKRELKGRVNWGWDPASALNGKGVNRAGDVEGLSARVERERVEDSGGGVTFERRSYTVGLE